MKPLKFIFLAIVVLVSGTRQALTFTHAGGGSNSAQCSPSAPSAPSQASSFGYTCAVIDTAFNSLNGVIDLNDTLAPGFGWYVHSQWSTATGGGTYWSGSPPVAASQYTNSGNNLVLNAPTVFSFGTATAGYLGGTSYVGKAIKPGFYVDFQVAYSPTIQSVTNGAWPAVWANPIEWVTGSLTPGQFFTELDVYEAFPALSPGNPISPRMTAIEWRQNSGSISESQASTNNIVSLGSADLTQLHHYGMLLVPMADNNGTGLIQRYFDTTHLTSADCSYTASAPSCTGITRSGGLTEIDSMHYMFILTTGYPNWPMTVGRVTVYCNPANTTDCHQ